MAAGEEAGGAVLGKAGPGGKSLRACGSRSALPGQRPYLTG